MTKHIADHDRSKGDTSERLKQYTRQERQAKPSEAAVKAQREERARGDGRLKEFTRIEREQG